MSGSELSQPQCSADALSGVDGSRSYILISPSPSSPSSSSSSPDISDTSGASGFSGRATSMSTSAHLTDAGSKQLSSALRLPEAPDTDLTDEAELELLPSLPPLKTDDCESLPSNADASSPSGSDLLGLSSPHTRSPTLSNSTATSPSTLHDGLAGGGVSLQPQQQQQQQQQHDDYDGPSWPSNIAENNGVPLEESDLHRTFLNHIISPPLPLTPHIETGLSDSPGIIHTGPENLLSLVSDIAGDTELPAGYDPLPSQNGGENSLTAPAAIGIVHTGPNQLVADDQDVLMESAYEDTDLSSDEDQPPNGHMHDEAGYLLVASATPTQSVTLPTLGNPESTTPTRFTIGPINQLHQATPFTLADFPPYELFDNGNELLTEFDFDAFIQPPEPMDLDNPTFGQPVNLFPHIQPIPQEWLANHPNLPFGIFGFTTTIDDDSPEWPGPQFHGEYERNLSFSDFCNMLSVKYRQDPVGNAECKINQDFIEILNFHLPPMVRRNQVDEYRLDYQGIPWRELDMERHRFRLLRNRKYSNYANLKPYPDPQRIPQFLSIRDNYFRFRKTCNGVDVKFSHFQLRNVISSTSKNDVFYTGDSTVMRFDAQSDQKHTIMDLRKPCSGDPIKITTLASDFGVIIAGGFYGEYAMLSLDSPVGTKPIEGLVTTDSNGITNHVHFFKSRTAGTPQAVFSSNDERLRILDCNLNKMVAEYKLPWAINCADTSPDGRLRVIVGDAKEVVIQGTDDGETIHRLPGHLDYGFACAWSDDGHTIATGNQDMMVRVYDARNFKREVAVLDADIAGARSLRFTPVGSGPRVLAFAEPADMVSIVDAVTWESRQRIDFFGEIAGITFSPDGRDLYIANSDRVVGGLMQFERWKTGHSGYPEDDTWRDEEDGEPPISRRRMRLRGINMDNLGIV